MQCELGQAVLVVGHLVPAAGFNERSQPVEPGVGPQHVIINLRIFCLVGFEILKQCLTPGNGLVGVECANHLGGVARGNDIFRDVAGHNRTSSDDAVLTNRDALADGRTIAQPDVVSEVDGASGADGPGSVIKVVPVGVGDIAARSQHAIIANGDLAGSIDPNPRAQ